MAGITNIVKAALILTVCVHLAVIAKCGRSDNRRPNRRVIREESRSGVVYRRGDNTENQRKNTSDSGSTFAHACASAVVQQGPPGQEGRPGNPGMPGMPGLPGFKGDKGECDCRQLEIPSVRHCAWNHHNYQRSAGPLQSCSFIKKSISTSLRLEWHGVARLVCQAGNSSCCARWYFTIDGNECNNPAPIDTIAYVDYGDRSLMVHRSQSVVGICRGASPGVHDVSFNVGDCQGGYARGIVKTGWNSASRIIIQEISSN